MKAAIINTQHQHSHHKGQSREKRPNSKDTRPAPRPFNSSKYAQGRIEVVNVFGDAQEIACTYFPTNTAYYGNQHDFSLTTADSVFWKVLGQYNSSPGKRVVLQIDIEGTIYVKPSQALGQLQRKKDLAGKVLHKTVLAPLPARTMRSKGWLGRTGQSSPARVPVWLSTALRYGRGAQFREPAQP